jgi:hypothetical protein
MLPEIFGGANTGGRPMAFRNGTLATRIGWADGDTFGVALALVTAR